MAEQRWRAYREGQGRVSILAKLSFSIPSRQKPRTLAPVARFLQRDLALVVETHIDPVTDLIVNSTRDRNASRHSDAFEPRCNIDAIAEDLVCRLLLEKKKHLMHLFQAISSPNIYSHPIYPQRS